MEQARPIRRALLSVSDKTGILEFAKALNERGVALLSTGGTAKLLADAGLPVTEVSDYTGFPEMMDGRVKTLHPKVHGGILGRRDRDDAIMAQHAISPIDMVVVNLYHFAATVTAFWAHINYVVSTLNNLKVMFDDYHGITTLN